MNPFALAAAAILALMTAGSTSISPLFVAYRAAWGISSADVAIVFSVYVGTLLPMLLFFGGISERFGRRPVAAAGIVLMAAGLGLLVAAHDLAWLVAARLLQGAGVGLAIGAVSAALAESYRGRTPSGNLLQRVASVGLFAGPVISSIAFNAGGGVNRSYLPALVLVIGLLVLVPFLVERESGTQQRIEQPHSPAFVACALRLALPLAFISWAGLSLYFSLVPAYLATALHAFNPAVGAGAVLASQLASLAMSFVFGNITSERAGIAASAASVAGLALLVAGTSLGVWPLIVLATLMVGGGSGLASGISYGIGARAGRGQRARILSRLFLAMYAGYSLPSLAVGLIASRSSFTLAFALVVAVLTVMTAALPWLRSRGVEERSGTSRPAPARAA